MGGIARLQQAIFNEAQIPLSGFEHDEAEYVLHRQGQLGFSPTEAGIGHTLAARHTHCCSGWHRDQGEHCANLGRWNKGCNVQYRTSMTV